MYRKINEVKGRGLELAKVFFKDSCSEKQVLPKAKVSGESRNSNTKKMRELKILDEVENGK